MIQHRFVRHFDKTLLFGVCLICATSTFAQTESDSELTTIVSELSSEFTVLSEIEVRSRQKERYDQIKDLLKSSSFDSEHQDLIAQALSESAMGVPVSSYRQKSFTEGTDMDPTETTQTFTVRDTGWVEETESSSFSLDGATTPFSNIAFIPLDPASGQILEENDSDFTIRFDVDIEIPEEEGMPEFVTKLVGDLKLAVDFKIDIKNKSLQTATFQLLEPLRKMFLFTFKKFKITYDFEYNENCACLAVDTMNIDMGGSVLFLGRFFMHASVTYSDIQCEQPIRYLIHDRGTDDVFRLLF